MHDKADEASRLLRQVANPRRLMILCHLSQGELSVGELRARIGVAQSALSQHLARLRADGLVATRRQAQIIHYRLASDEVARVVETLFELFCSREAQAGMDPGRRAERF